MTASRASVAQLVEDLCRDIPDFPKPGVVFKDITPLLANAEAFSTTVRYLADYVTRVQAEAVVGVEARGFILAAPSAFKAGVGFIPLRKPGKLPGHTLRQSYSLEYAEAALEVHDDLVRPGLRVVIMDDVLATGGTAAAAADLLEAAGAEVVGMSFLIELGFLDGRSKLAGRPFETVAQV
ncbi:MAG: adenine phosphoribosyltransferase [Bifidobacteriaceae bacterium]|jgi:adenine phosphoribosyltransferase|nr:adenine phosphoribosyltransferase [Bifidobacteriaceae bacterium]